MTNQPEIWLTGNKTPGLYSLLQPVADALLQAEIEIKHLLQHFPDALLWNKPYGCASVGFHLKHIAGFLDRLISYAEGKQLTTKQLTYLKNEEVNEGTGTQFLIDHCANSIHQTIERLKQFDEPELKKERKVGRKELPATVMGLCVHAAEHTMRHTGQLLVTLRVVAGT